MNITTNNHTSFVDVIDYNKENSNDDYYEVYLQLVAETPWKKDKYCLMYDLLPSEMDCSIKWLDSYEDIDLDISKSFMLYKNNIAMYSRRTNEILTST